MINNLIIEKDKEIDSLRAQVRILHSMAFSAPYHASRTATGGVVDEEDAPKATSSPFNARSFEEYEVISIQTDSVLVDLKVYTFNGKPFVLSNNLNQCLPYRANISKEVTLLSNWLEFKQWSTIKIANRVKGIMVDGNLINWIQNFYNSAPLLQKISHLIPTSDISMNMDVSMSMISPVKLGLDEIFD
jgi:hypothetical protein